MIMDDMIGKYEGKPTGSDNTIPFIQSSKAGGPKLHGADVHMQVVRLTKLGKGAPRGAC